MELNNFECNRLMPLHFKGLRMGHYGKISSLMTWRLYHAWREDTTWAGVTANSRIAIVLMPMSEER